jgi:aspartate 1-decarboxylase
MRLVIRAAHIKKGGWMRKLVAGKLHGLRVTESNPNYDGSITLDPNHCEEAGILPMEFVDIWNKSSGARISTYVMLGVRGSRCCILNGAAARTCQQGDEIIISNSVYLDEGKLTSLNVTVLNFDAHNNIIDSLSYSVTVDALNRYQMRIVL